MHFEKPGKQNTQETVKIALQAAKELGIDTIVVATSTGDTADLLKDAAQSGLHVVAVSHCFGFKDPEEQEMPAQRKAALEAAGIQVYTATHVLSGAERGLSAKFGGISPIEVMAHSLRMLGQGTKVAVECAVMALDGGLIPYQKPVISIGGSGRGGRYGLGAAYSPCRQYSGYKNRPGTVQTGAAVAAAASRPGPLALAGFFRGDWPVFVIFL